MKHILVPVDFTDYAYNACQYALHLASQSGADVTIFHAYHIPIVDPLMPSEYLSDLAESAEKEINNNMNGLVKQLNDYLAHQNLNAIQIKSEVTMGFAVDEIILACEKMNVNLIVMGRRLTEGMTKILLGSVTSSIVEKSNVPVLVVPENVRAGIPVKDFMYAIEYDDADSKTLDKLLAFTRPLKAKVHCVHVLKDSENGASENLKALQATYADDVKKGNIEFLNIISDDVSTGLLEFADTHNINILVMLTHKRSFFVKLFDRSLTQKIAFKVNVPLMVFHHKA